MAISEEQVIRTMTLMRVRNSEIDFQRIPLEAESKLMDLIRQGKPEELRIGPFSRMKENLGVMAMDPMTQYTYLTVAAVTLFSRAALEGGVQADDVFDLSDALLNTLSNARSLEEVHDIYALSAVMFARQVAQQQSKKASVQVERIRNYIGRNIFRKITLADLAEYMEMSPNYLCNLFTAQSGISIHQYIQREKMDVACNLLQHTDRSISDIAMYMGFQTQSNFSAIFRKWKGMTPTEYRRRHYREVY